MTYVFVGLGGFALGALLAFMITMEYATRSLGAAYRDSQQHDLRTRRQVIEKGVREHLKGKEQ